MADILNNPTFMQIVMIGGAIIPWILLFIFKAAEPNKNVKRGISYGLTALLYVVAILISKVYVQWHGWWEWVLGLVANLIYVKMLFEVVIKTFIPDKWRHELFWK